MRSGFVLCVLINLHNSLMRYYFYRFECLLFITQNANATWSSGSYSDSVRTGKH